MPPRSLFFIGMALLAALACPLGSAHAQPYSDSQSLSMGPYAVYLVTDPDPLFASLRTLFRASVSDSETGYLSHEANVTLTLQSPGASTIRLVLHTNESDPTYEDAPVTLPHWGNYTVRVDLEASRGAYNKTTYFTAYPNLPIRIVPDSNAADPIVGQPYLLEFRVTNSTTGQPVTNLFDFEVRLEHWSDDHRQMFDSRNLSLSQDAPGSWRDTITVTVPGMYHMRMRSASGHFEPDQVPTFHTYATLLQSAPGASSGSGAPTPSVGLGASLAGLAAAVLLAAKRR